MSEYPTIAECSGYDDDDDNNVCSHDPFYNHDVDHSISRQDDRFDAWEGDDDWAEMWEESDWDDYADHLDSQGHDDPPGPSDDSGWVDRADCVDLDDVPF